jgi:BspA type Leucine rich repeat region (6 copies)
MKTKIQNLFKAGRSSLPLLVALGILGLIQTAEAQFDYTVQNGTITITGYYGSGGAVTIPATINGTNVTSIGENVFEFIFSLTSVTIPNSVTNIGSAAFVCCTSLTTVTIPNSVTSIEIDAFDGCTSLTSALFQAAS